VAEIVYVNAGMSAAIVVVVVMVAMFVAPGDPDGTPIITTPDDVPEAATVLVNGAAPYGIVWKMVTVPATTVDETDAEDDGDSVETDVELELDEDTDELVDTTLELDELETELDEDELLDVELGTPNTTDAVPPITVPE